MWRTVSGFCAISLGGAFAMSAVSLGVGLHLAALARVGVTAVLLLASVACIVQGCRVLRYEQPSSKTSTAPNRSKR